MDLNKRIRSKADEGKGGRTRHIDFKFFVIHFFHSFDTVKRHVSSIFESMTRVGRHENNANFILNDGEKTTDGRSSQLAIRPT